MESRLDEIEQRLCTIRRVCGERGRKEVYKYHATKRMPDDPALRCRATVGSTRRRRIWRTPTYTVQYQEMSLWKQGQGRPMFIILAWV